MTAYPCGIRTATRRTFLSVLGALVAVPFVRWRQAPDIDEAGDIDAIKASVNGTLHTNDELFFATLDDLRAAWRQRSHGILMPDRTRMGHALYARYEQLVIDDRPPHERFVLADGSLPFQGRPADLDGMLSPWLFEIDGGLPYGRGPTA